MIPVSFTYNSKEVRAIEHKGNPWFVASDLCFILGVKDTSMALKRIPASDKDTSLINTLGGVQRLSIVNEPGMYRLVMSSRKKEAESFKTWLASEVLPEIRQTGSYHGTMKITQNELIQLMATENVKLEKRVDEGERRAAEDGKRITILERIVGLFSSSPTIKEEPVALIALPAPVAEKVKAPSKLIVLPRALLSGTNEFLTFHGFEPKQGFSQGVGRSATFLCEERGIEIQYELISKRPGSKTKRPLYPKSILLEVLQSRGLL
jgi:prophage antirepressor-like protein